MHKKLTENKKIKNATPLEYDDIKFKSKLEKTVYQTLKEKKFFPLYEKKTFTLVPNFKSTTLFYDRWYDRTLKQNVWDNVKYVVQAWTYTPDFTFKYKDYLIVIEVKGWKNDVTGPKMKAFHYYMETHPEEKIVFFEVYNKRETLKAIEVINNLN